MVNCECILIKICIIPRNSVSACPALLYIYILMANNKKWVRHIFCFFFVFFWQEKYNRYKQITCTIRRAMNSDNMRLLVFGWSNMWYTYMIMDFCVKFIDIKMVHAIQLNAHHERDFFSASSFFRLWIF